MRDIKFRAWDNLEKRMRKVVSLHWQDDKLVSAKLEGENEPIPIKGRLVIEQSTGLKDINGTEICGGDILIDDTGEPVRYETREEAKKSIIENREDWKIYFGIKEWE